MGRRFTPPGRRPTPSSTKEATMTALLVAGAAIVLWTAVGLVCRDLREAGEL